jgi:tetratricopeptide (TPR) repeat protein
MTKKSSPSLPLGLIFGLLLVIATGSYFLLPKSGDVLLRRLQDEQIDRARLIFDKLSKKQMEADPRLVTLAKMKFRRSEVEKSQSKRLLREEDVNLLLNEALGQYERQPSYRPFLNEALMVLSRSDEPRIAIERTRAIQSTFSPKDAKDFEEALINLSKRGGNPAVAAGLRREQIGEGEIRESALRELVDLWRAGGRPQEAIEDLDGYQVSARSMGRTLSWKWVDLKIQLLRELNRNSEAYDLLLVHRALCEADRGDRKTLQLMGLCASQSGRAVEMIPLYEQWLDRHEADFELWEILGELYASDKRFDDAAKALQKFTDRNPHDIQKQIRLAQYLEWGGHPQRAFDLYLKRAEDRDPFVLERMKSLNAGLYRDRDLISALRFYVPQEGTNPELLLLGEKLIKLGEYQQAAITFRQHLQSKPDDLTIGQKLGSLLREMGELDKAIEALEKLQRKGTVSESLLKDLALLYNEVGRFDDALAIYKTLVAESTDETILESYIKASESLGEYRLLVDGLEAWIAQGKSTPAHLFNRLSYFYSLLGEKEAGRRILSDAIKRYPLNVDFRYDYSAFVLGEGDLEAAYSTLQGFINRDTPLWIRLSHMQTSLGLGKIKEFKKDWDELEASSPTCPSDYASAFGSIHEAIGNHQASLPCYRRAWESQPESIEEICNLARIEARRGRIQYARRLIDSIPDEPRGVRENKLIADTLVDVKRDRIARQNYLEWISKVGLIEAPTPFTAIR